MARREEISTFSEAELPEAQGYPSLSTQGSELIYGLYDKPPVVESIFVAVQHVLAAFVGIVTPPLIICTSLGIDAANTSFLISMSLFASGICTYIQCKTFGPLGSGLLSLQGTSFAFLGAILGVGNTAIQSGKTPVQALSLIFGVCFFGAFANVMLSRFLHLLSKVVTPIVSGSLVMLIGLSLLKTGITSMAGGTAALKNGTFANAPNLALGFGVFAIVIILTLAKNQYIRMGAIAIGLVIGYIASAFMGMVDFSIFTKLPLVSVPIPFRYGMDFEIGALIPFLILYPLTAIESVGDLTATSMVSKEPISGSVYIRRIKAGVLADGFNSSLAALLNTFPITTFSQNTGVIQMTGVGSRYVGFFVSGILVLLGLLPIVSGAFQSIPQPVLGGATTVMFGSIAVAGVKIIASEELDRRSTIIIAVSLALGLGVVFVPELFNNQPAPIKNMFASATSTGGLTAILLSWLLPQTPTANSAPSAEREIANG
ncbi:uracil-xanthine permease family protein [Chamaesiphon minutus]|uniref:Uracil-xanthine permease n=1 Tax=Chamaesiphon minutus (strain ATCC 27169 / PCC 6605) TaxID=1173020 RepID=K9UD56_CHAP6|nr:nucleobase:cation symporter-2 family protein [Chamaesiphon minutus]AFY92144.1 uracil-xanthine permease [Chamaesiphon minutus PCC 6605]